MHKSKNFIRFFLRKIFPTRYPIVINPSKKNKHNGVVLFSYLPDPILWQVDDSRFYGHSNKWSSREFAQIFLEKGYRVEAIRWDDFDFVPRKKYDLVFDICYNLGRLSSYWDNQTIKILLCTGSDPFYQNAAETSRVHALNLRKKSHYQPKRLVKNPELAQYSMQLSDVCALKGNSHTLSTYPVEFHHKISLVTVAASDIGNNIRTPSSYVPAKREFLWFGGSGSVHKGLDLLLEVFIRNPHLTLNVIGKIDSDLIAIYADELNKASNINFHGFLHPHSEDFREKIKDTFCVIAPTCSEAISAAVATSLQVGFFPILSKDAGISLPDECGVTLIENSIDEIENMINRVYQMPTQVLIPQIQKIQKYALENYSRKQYRADMENFLDKVLKN